MMPTLDQILPSLASLGLWSYWIIGLGALLEAFFATGVIVPGTLIVDAGGILVQQGALDFFDLVWFVVIGSVLGSEISYWAGVLARRGLDKRWNPASSAVYVKAEALFRRHGGWALVIGRFLGPLSGLVSFAASVAGMERRRFFIWNILSAAIFALVHVSLGYFLGDVITRLGPIATRAALLAGAVAVLLALVWWLVIRVERMLPFVLSVLYSIGQGVAANPGVRDWATRHPRLAGWIVARLDTSRFGGLTATLLAAAFTYILFIWVASVLDFILAEPIVQVDQRVASLVHAFWSPTLLRLFAYITALGDWRVVAALMAAAVALLLSRRRYGLAVGLAIAVLGDIVTVTALKLIFRRPRPDLAYFIETSGSFPSGHAAIAVAFYGTVFFIAWRLRWIGPLAAALLAATLAFLIGFSRIYLIEHYLTDVLNGWLVGGLWLVIAIAIAEWWACTHSARTDAPSVARHFRLATAAAGVVLIAAAGWTIATYDKARSVALLPSGPQTVASAAAPFLDGTAPMIPESVTGTPLEPVNVLVSAPDRAALIRAMQSSGWVIAVPPSVSTVASALWADFSGNETATAPVTPYFWAGQPNDLAFEKPAGGANPKNRHHIRFWQSRFATSDGLRLFVGAASLDDALDWTLLHQVDPDIDAERDALVRDLQAAGVAGTVARVRILTTRRSESDAGNPWFSDGAAAVVTLR
tara:strand:- start:702 stop:2798 length:2097 start_codon:yes stop_codon:yes gene_type:complete